jgi:hypothetical protein
MSTEKANDTLWNRTSDLPICSTERFARRVTKLKIMKLKFSNGNILPRI